MTALFIIRWRGTDFGAFTWRDANKAITQFYPGGEILPA
jgi:hypothetical protein